MGCWVQELGPDSTMMTLAKGSSILQDEVNAGFNDHLAQWLDPGDAHREPAFKYAAEVEC